MLPVRIAGTTHTLGAPKDWDESVDGKCCGLAIRFVDGCCQSAWQPTPKELDILNAGGSVVLSIVGNQPPVNLSCEPFVEGD